MYKIYVDKKELFEAKIELEGASLTDTRARLLVETDRWNLVFNGEIDSVGNVTIPIEKMKSIFSENTSGTVKLEVVVDDTFFTPWQDEVSLSRSKQLTAEVKEGKKSLINEECVKVTSVNNKKVITEDKENFNNNLQRKFLKSIIKNAYLSETKKFSKPVIKETVSTFIEENNFSEKFKKELYQYIKENREVLESGLRNIRV